MSPSTRIASTAHSRRHFLSTLLSAAAALALPGAATAQGKDTLSADTPFAALLADFADEVLRLSPTAATALGLDKDAHAALKSQLEDLGPAGDEKWAAQVKSMLARLHSVDRALLGPEAQIHYDTVHYAASAGVDGLRFSYGGAAGGFHGGAVPYPVTQQDGTLLTIPEFLDSQHQIANAADAEAYLARVAAMARALDQESARIAAQAAKGIVPPRAICANALGQLRDYRKTAIAQQKLVTSLAGRAKQLGIAGDWQKRAVKLVKSLVYPALDRQIAALAKAAAKAPDVAGVHRLPDGAAYYEWALRLGTTTNRSPKEIHEIGLEQYKQLQARIDTLLKAQGMGQGTVGARLRAVSQDPARFYPDNDQGRAQLIAYCNERVAAIRALMPQLSHLNMKAPLLVKRVPVDIESGAQLGYMNFGALDGSRPSIYYINLKSTRLWPKSEIATLTAHEGLPGHAWQGAYLAEHHAELPLISSLMAFNAFVEGWALYAEQLVDEHGLYANDPFSQIGYLQAQLFRACRLVVDTGLHAMKWTRQQAIDFLVENTGRGVEAMTSEVDRYTVWPGQACGYKMGHNEILRQRERAKAALGAKFDLAGFNDALVKSAGVPLTVLPAVVERFIQQSRKA